MVKTSSGSISSVHSVWIAAGPTSGEAYGSTRYSASGAKSPVRSAAGPSRQARSYPPTHAPTSSGVRSTTVAHPDLGGRRGVGALPRAGDRRDLDRLADQCLHLVGRERPQCVPGGSTEQVAPVQTGNQRAHERVARAHRVDDVHRDAREVDGAGTGTDGVGAVPAA